MKITNLPTDLLRTFVTVSDFGGYTRAGKVLGRTQPAISLQMRRLEHLIESPLFAQKGRRLALTEDGQLLAVYARQILRLNDEALARFRGLDAKGVTNVGIPVDHTLFYLQEVVSGFMEEHPDNEVSVHCDLNHVLLERLANNELDVVVAATSERVNENLARAWSDQPVWVSAKGSDLHKRVPLPIVCHPDGCEYHARICEALNVAGVRWRASFVGPGVSAVQSAVEASLGISALPLRAVTERMQVRGEADGLPAIGSVRIGLFYKHNRLNGGSLALVNRLLKSLDDNEQSTEIF